MSCGDPRCLVCRPPAPVLPGVARRTASPSIAASKCLAEQMLPAFQARLHAVAAEIREDDNHSRSADRLDGIAECLSDWRAAEKSYERVLRGLLLFAEDFDQRSYEPEEEFASYVAGLCRSALIETGAAPRPDPEHSDV